MKKFIILILLTISFFCKAQDLWNQNGDNTTTGRIGIGVSTPASDFDIDIFRTNPNTGIKMFNSNWAGRSIVLFGQGFGGKYGYVAHHGQSYVTSPGYTQTYKTSSTVLEGGDINGLGIISASDIRFSSGGSDDTKQRMIINASGNVGIGTSSPDRLLTIDGEIGFFRNVTSPTSVSAGFIKYENGFIFGNNSTADPLRLQTNSIDRIFVANDGKVGIGCIAPDAKLTVKGTVHSEEVKVDIMNSICPDYVFEKDYNLLPLSELEAYINTNKHLPEVPSANEFEANGLNLKEMNLILLKKVEELTLHLIEAKKENEKLNRTSEEILERLSILEKAK